MQVTSLFRPRGNPGYYTRGFRQTIEDHLSILQSQIAEHAIITERQRAMYLGDLYGLLNELGVAEEHQWTTMRCNGWHATSDFIGDVEVIALIKPEAIQAVLERYLSTQEQL